jgi:hypothetical protein
MAWRKWLVRSLVLAVAGTSAAAVFVWQRWTNAAAVRQEVVARLEHHLPGASARLESAGLRLLGGISLSELRLVRRDDPEQNAFIYVPSGAIYHDKEQLLKGKLGIRKIEWTRPRLHVVRGRDGHWNLAGILGPVDPDVPIPTIVLRRGTLLFEDRAQGAGLPPLIVKDVDLTIINDPLPTLVFQGTGVTELAGRVEVRGTWGRVSEEFTLSIRLPGFPVDGRLVQYLAAYWPEAAPHVRQLTGTADLQADFHYQPEGSRWSQDVTFQLHQGRLIHAQLPMPLEDIEGRLRYADGQIRLDGLTATSGQGRLQLTAHASAASAEADLAGSLRWEHLPVSQRLFTQLPVAMQRIERDYHPEGTVTVDIEFGRRSGRWHGRCALRLEEVSAMCVQFPYRLEHLEGTIDHEFDAAVALDAFKIDLVGTGGGRPVYIQGKIDDRIDLKIWADNVPIDDQLRGALRPAFQKLVRQFNPSGVVDVRALVRRGVGEREAGIWCRADVHDAALRYEVFPYPLENVRGTIDIRPDHWEFRDFRGDHNGGEFQARGGAAHAPAGEGVAVFITGTGVLLDDQLAAALRYAQLKRAWSMLHPAGRIDFQATVNQPAARDEPDIAVTVVPRGCSTVPAFFPYALAGVTGVVRYHDHQVDLSGLEARHGPTVLRVERGKLTLKPGGDIAVDLVNLTGRPLTPDADFVRALPPALGELCAKLGLVEPVTFHTDLTIEVPDDPTRPPYIYWDGGVALADATLSPGIPLGHVSGSLYCRGQHRGDFGNVLGNVLLETVTVYGQPLQHVQSQIVVDARQPDILELPNLKARLYGGDVGGSLRLRISPAVAFDLDLTASEIDLEEFGRCNRLGPDAQLSGLAFARLALSNQGPEPGELQGGGWLDVPSGKMYNLPLLLDLLKVLSGRVPDKTAFEEAHARFRVQGRRVKVERLELFGAAVSLSGQGTMNLDGSDLNLDFYAIWSRLVQWLPPVIDKIPAMFSQYLFKVKMRGRAGGKVECIKEPVPVFVEPLKEVLRRMQGPKAARIAQPEEAAKGNGPIGR